MFAGETNSVILAGVEFSEAAKEYPIVFTQAGDKVVPVAMLGLRNEENLFVDDKGGWDGRYIPSFVRRYPFVLAETGETGQQAVCIDDAYEGFNDDEGEPLFAGEETTPLPSAGDRLSRGRPEALSSNRSFCSAIAGQRSADVVQCKS